MRSAAAIPLFFAVMSAGFCAEPQTAGDESLQQYSNAAAGYSFRVPQGFRQLSEDENRKNFEGISEVFGKETAERIQKHPPVYFAGPVDSKRPNELPPSIAVGYTDLNEPIDPANLPAYKDQLEEAYRKQGTKAGEIKLEIVQVDGSNALRVERDEISKVNNAREKLIIISIHGNRRRYDVIFNFSPQQKDKIEEAVAVVLRTFKLSGHAEPGGGLDRKWTRIALWTVGGFLAGVFLSMVARKWTSKKTETVSA